MPEAVFAYTCDEHRGEDMVPLDEPLVLILEQVPKGMPPPGLNAARRDACVVCLQETDTGLAFTGDAEWVLAGLIVLGVSEEQAALMVSKVTENGAGMEPDGEITFPVRVCRRCAGAGSARFPVGLLSCVIPNIGQRKST